MILSRSITPEIIAAVTSILRPYCAELSASDLVAALTNHRSDTAKQQTLQPSLTYAGFAKLAGLSMPTVHRMAKRGELPTFKMGPRLVRIPYAAVEKILNGLK